MNNEEIPERGFEAETALEHQQLQKSIKNIKNALARERPYVFQKELMIKQLKFMKLYLNCLELRMDDLNVKTMNHIINDFGDEPTEEK